MYRKIISVMSVALVVFLCFQFPAFAVTGGGKTIVSNSYSYNNGDVTVYVRVNGQAAEELYEGQHYYPHNFTVTLANNTNEFQVADVNNFSVDLYSGSATAFASNQNAWGAEVTSYSDNMTVPRITMYPSGDLAGHVLVAFNDSDLLVLNPNETRTYNFSINFIQTDNINYTPLNGNFRYSYFTYTGTVGFYARPTSFSSNTIEEFINNNSLPNSAIAYYQYLIEQGIEDQELLNNILDTLMSQPSNTSFGSNASSIITSYGFSTNLATSPIGVQAYATVTYPIPIDKSFNINGYDFSSPSYSNSSIYKVSTYIDFRISNTTSNTYSSPALSFRFNVNLNDIMLDQGYYYSTDYTNIVDEGVTFTLLNGNTLYFTVLEREGNKCLYPSGAYYRGVVRIDRYFVVENISGNITRPLFLSTSKLTASNYVAPTMSVYSQSLISSITKNFADIRDRIQSILDSYNANVPAAEEVTDTSEDTQDVVSDQHDIESGYFEDTQTYITDTGIQNFQFDPSITGGLGGVKDDFTAVWTSCGTLAQYWIASLTIGLALSIIRHRRMFSK